MPIALNSPRRDEDLFAESTMTFGEHLDELRSALVKAVLALTIGTLMGMLVGRETVQLIAAPLQDALGEYQIGRAKTQFKSFAAAWENVDKPVPYTEAQVNELLDEDRMLFDIQYVHPQLLRQALDPTAATAATISAERSALEPILFWHPLANDSRISIKAFNAAEAFAIWFKASLMTGALLSSPFVFYYLWTFVAAGLYKHERRYVYIFLPFSLGLFFVGAAVAYFFVFGPVLGFLLSFNDWLGIDPDPRISEWLGFVLLLPIGFGLSFQLPLVMLFLERIGIFTVQAYIEKWRIAILVIFFVSALLMPGDPTSLLLMSLSLIVLYFGGVQLCRWMPRRSTGVEATT